MLAVEDGRQVRSRGLEGGGQLQRPAEQVFAVAQPADTRRHLGQHADRAIVKGVALQPFPQQWFCLMQHIGDQRVTGAEQGRVRRGRLQCPLLELRGLIRLAGGP
jgi:hypothetical protein